MLLTEITAVPQAALPIQALKDHLRLGSGFALPVGQDGLLESYLRAALATIEGRTSKALMQRDFLWSLEDWRDPGEQALPIAPISAVGVLTLVAASGAQTVVPAGTYRLVTDQHRPRLAGVGTTLPSVPTGGRVTVQFTAGFGATWANVPPDLGHAVMLLAAEYFEHRHGDEAAATGLPHAVQALIERWRPVRILGGRGRS